MVGRYGEVYGVGTTFCILETETKAETRGVVEGKAVVCGGSLGLHDGCMDNVRTRRKQWGRGSMHGEGA